MNQEVAEPEIKSAETIIAEVDHLARKLAKAQGWEPEEPIPGFQSISARARAYWDLAVLAYEDITGTEVHDAIIEFEENQREQRVQHAIALIPPVPPAVPQSKSTWTTRDGRVLRPVEMTTQHLINAVKQVRRKVQYRILQKHFDDIGSAAGAMVNGEGAQMALDHELAYAEPDRWYPKAPPVVKDMIEVLKLRGIETADLIAE